MSNRHIIMIILVAVTGLSAIGFMTTGCTQVGVSPPGGFPGGLPIERVSLDDSGTEGDDGSFGPSLSGDGRYVAFGSIASNLVTGDSNASSDTFVSPLQ